MQILLVAAVAIAGSPGGNVDLNRVFKAGEKFKAVTLEHVRQLCDMFIVGVVVADEDVLPFRH